MKHVIIGTAGHIDHGKTTLIKALTGRDTDTLKEEKERGISINLGFTFFDLPSGKRAGIIDVPGHEKFVKNMLAGASSIDVVLLVVAADEGIMPQTREHFEILQLLGVKKGIIVLTKSDMVDEEWLSMITEDIKAELLGSFLEQAPVISVSSKTHKGIDQLIKSIDAITEEVETKDTEGHFRLPVDRVFSVSGFGTVVTGTIISGRVKEGEIIEVYPSKIMTKVRNLQIHEEAVSFAEAGQRCAINLSNIKVNEIDRGNVISKEAVMEPSMIVDCNIYYLKSASKPLVNRQRVRLYHGTDEILCRVVLLNKEELKQGESAYVQLRLEKPITAQRNDRFVIRSYSPMYTIGGGTIIEPAGCKAKRFDEEYIKNLQIKESGKAESIIEGTIEKLSGEYPGEFEILKALGKNEENIAEKIQELLDSKCIIGLVSLDKKVFIHKKFLKQKITQIEEILEKFHKANPLKVGISKEEIKSKVFGKNIKQKIYDEIIELIQDRNIIKVTNNFISLFDFAIVYTKDQKEIVDRILTEYAKAKYLPPKYEDLSVKEKDKKKFKMVFDNLIDNGRLIKVSEDAVFSSEDFDNAKDLIIKYIKEHGSLTAAEGRDILNTSRKYAVALLEYFDSIKLTRRVEEKRVLYSA